jgi:hypothetical protein
MRGLCPLPKTNRRPGLTSNDLSAESVSTAVADPMVMRENRDFLRAL